MRNTREENISEHSLDVAVLAHALAVLRNRRFHGDVDPERAALLGIFHDATEIYTGDLPTPVKYDNPKIRDAYREVEQAAREKLLDLLPEDLRPDYEGLLGYGKENEELVRLVKAADKLSALIKCVVERRMGNTEFVRAEAFLWEALEAMALPEVDCFLKEFLPSYSLTLDEQE